LGFSRRKKGCPSCQKSGKGRFFQIEVLEERQLLSVCTWDGGSTVDSKWTTAANWVGDVAPQAGDNVVFDGTARTTTENDFAAGTSFGYIGFYSSGFTLTGNSISLPNGGVISGQSGTIAMNITLGGELYVHCPPFRNAQR
jgi:hypothetical protein